MEEFASAATLILAAKEAVVMQEKCWSANEERFEGDFDAVCQEAFDCADDGEDEVCIEEGDSLKCTAVEFFDDANLLLENAQERAWSELGECTENWMISLPKEEKDELDAELKKVISAWAKKYDHEPNFWRVNNIKTITVKRVGEDDYQKVA